jgi:O-antigen/teichoic acid export membrane protein
LHDHATGLDATANPPGTPLGAAAPVADPIAGTAPAAEGSAGGDAVRGRGSGADPRAHRRKMYLRAVWSGAVARSLNILVQALSISLTVRYLGKERFGVWATISTIITWLSVANFGIGHGLTTRVSAFQAESDREAAYRSIFSAWAIVLFLALAALPVCLLAASLLPWPSILGVTGPLAAKEATPTVFVCVLLVLAALPLNTFGSVLLGYQRSDIVNATAVVSSTAGLALLFVATRLGWGMPALAATLMLPALAAAAVQAALASRLGFVRFARRYFSAHEARSMLRLGSKFLLLQLFGIMIFETGALIIAGKFGAAEVTPYGVTNRVAMIVMIVMTIMAIVMTPLWPAYGDAFARGDTAWARRVFFKSVRVVVGIWVVAAVALAVAGKYLIRWWAGPDAVPSDGLLWAMLLYTLAYGCGLVVAQPLNGSGHLNTQVLAAVVTAALNIPLAIFLAGRLGVWGVVMSQAGLMIVLAIPIQLVGVFRVLDPTRGVAGPAGPAGRPEPGAASAAAPQNHV